MQKMTVALLDLNNGEPLRVKVITKAPESFSLKILKKHDFKNFPTYSYNNGKRKRSSKVAKNLDQKCDPDNVKSNFK